MGSCFKNRERIHISGEKGYGVISHEEGITVTTHLPPHLVLSGLSGHLG